MFEQRKQRDSLNLKVGDTAYFLCDEFYGDFELVTITGECEEGEGYEANSPAWAEKHEGDGGIHTCNGSLFKTKQDARAETLRILKKTRKELAERVAQNTRCIQYIDYRLHRGGKK